MQAVTYDPAHANSLLNCPHCNQLISNAAHLHPPQQQTGYHCPVCRQNAQLVAREQISTAGWIVFAVLLVTFFPLFWIGLLMKEQYFLCSSCGTKRL